MYPWFTVGAFFLLVIIAIIANRANERDRSFKVSLSEPELHAAFLHTRQDLRLVAYLLMGMILMLGIIADRIH